MAASTTGRYRGGRDVGNHPVYPTTPGVCQACTGEHLLLPQTLDWTGSLPSSPCGGPQSLSPAVWVQVPLQV
jgi:hypothetical protein